MDEPTKYEDHDIVWVKLGNCWWPGEVCSESRLPEGILKAVRKRPLVIVQFFDEPKYEYVKNINNICKYNDPRKNEFIQKGLDLLRSNKKYMEKFPLDVSRAERMTDGDVNIISREQFNPIKKISLSNMFSDDDRKQKGKGNKRSPGRPSASRKIKIESPQPLLHTPPKLKATAVFTTISPLPPRVPNPTPDQYSCKMCPFTTSRCNIMIMHMKTHTKNTSPQIQSPINKLPTGGQTVVEKENEENTNLNLRQQSPHQNDTHDMHHGNRQNINHEPKEEDAYKIMRMEPPKKRRLPKKPGLKHIILADWSEDDDDEDEAEKSRKEGCHLAKSSASLSENRSPNLLNTSLTLNVDNTNDSRKEQENSPSSEKASNVPKYRNIPKKDRRDIVLSEFNNSNVSINDSDNQLPGIKSDKDDVNDNRLDKISHVDISQQEIVMTPSKDISSIAATDDKVVGIEIEADLPNENAEEIRKPKEVINKDNIVTQSITEKQKEVKKLSCFDFKDDEEDDTEDFLSSLSKLKQKYMSPDKHKLVEADVTPTVEEEKKIGEQRDAQLVADIENLLNVTQTPELAKVEPEPVPSDVRGLPPKERGKRIFKSRNRTKIDKVDTDVKTGQVVSPENYQRQTSANDSSGDSRLESDTLGNNLDESAMDTSAANESNASLQKKSSLESINESAMNQVLNVSESNLIADVEFGRESNQIQLDAAPLERVNFPPDDTIVSNLHETKIAAASEMVQHENTIDDQQEEISVQEMTANEDEAIGVYEKQEVMLNEPAVIEQPDNGVCLDDNESIDSTIVEVSEGNSNLLMAESEHDLSVLAAAETLISMPNKLCVENRLESVGLDYHTANNLQDMPLTTMPGSPEILPDYEQQMAVNEEEISSAQVQAEDMMVPNETVPNMEQSINVQHVETQDETGVKTTEVIAEKTTEDIAMKDCEETVETASVVEASAAKAKNQIGRKTAAKRQKRRTGLSESASADISNEDLTAKLHAKNYHITGDDPYQEIEAPTNQRTSRTTRNKSKKLIETQDTETLQVNLEVRQEDVPIHISTDNQTENLQTQSEEIISIPTNINQNIDNADECSTSSLTTTKKRGKGKKSKDIASEAIVDDSVDMPQDSNTPTTEERGKRSKRRSQKIVDENIVTSEALEELERQVKEDIAASLVYSHPEDKHDQIEPHQISNQAIEGTRIYGSSNEELQSENVLSECQSEVDKQMDLDFEKLDLAELQSQTEQQHNILRTDLTEGYMPLNHNHTIQAQEVENIEEVINEKTICIAEQENLRLETEVQVEKPFIETSNTELPGQNVESEEYDQDRKSKRKRTRKKETEEPVESKDAHEFSFDTTLNTTVETDSIDHLPDSEENRLVIDTDELHKYDVSEDAEGIIQFNDLVQQEERANHEIKNDVETGEVICHIFSDETPANENDGGRQNGEIGGNEQSENPESNAAEQILDEISNLTSSIDIILDSERTNDDSPQHLEDSKEAPQVENHIENTSIDVSQNESENAEGPAYPMSQSVDNGEPFNGNNTSQLEKSSESSGTLISENLPSDASLVSPPVESPNIQDYRGTSSRKRNSHLKYTPPKTSNANNTSSEEVSPEYEEIVQDSQLTTEEANRTIESMTNSSAIVGSSPETTVVQTEPQIVSCENDSKGTVEKRENIETNVTVSRPPDGIFEPSEVTVDYIESPSSLQTKILPDSKTTVAPKATSTPMLINMFQFDTEPIIPCTEKKSQVTRQKKDNGKNKHRIDAIIKKAMSFSMSLSGNESKVSSKRRLSKLKDDTTKEPAVTMSEEIQERFKVYSFDDQIDSFEIPKKSKYSNSKENRNDRSSLKAENKSVSAEGSKSHTSSTEKPKHSRSRQLNLQNVSDVCIPKFPKIDRTKRPTQEPQEHAKNEYDIVDPKQKFAISPEKNNANLQMTPASNRFSHQESQINFNTLEMEGIIPMPTTPTSSGQNVGANEFVTTSTYGEIQLSTTALSSFTSTPAITSKKKSRATTSTNRKSKQQQQQQLALQQSIVSPSIYDSYSLQQSFEVNSPQTIVPSKTTKGSAKEKNSRKQTSMNIEDTTQSFTINQGGSNDKRGQVISSQTIVMTGPQISSPKGPIIKTCAGDPLFITSKGNLISSNPTMSYSSGYFETKQQQRIPELITSVTQYPITSSASATVHHPATSQKATNTEHRPIGSTPNRRGANMSDAAKDNARSAEIKRLEQKPIGKVLTAHGFNEIEPLTVNVIHGKSLRDNTVVDMPVLVPIGEPHTPTQRMTSKRSASHSPKDTSNSPRNSKQMRNNQGNGMNQQNLLTGVSSFDQSGAHLVRDHTKHDLSENVDTIFNQQLQTTVMPHHQPQQRKQHQQQGQQQLHHNQRAGQQMHQQQSYEMIQQNQVADNQNQLYHSQPQQMQAETQTHNKQFHGKRKKADHEHMTAAQQKKLHQEQQQQMKMHHEQQQQQPKPQQMQQQYKLQQEQLQQTHHILQQEQEQQQLQLNQQLQHEQQMHQEQLQLQFHQELQLQQEQQLQLEQHLQQHQDAGLQEHQEIVIQQTDDGENIIGDQLLVQEGGNAFYVDLKNIVTVMSSPEGEIAAVQLANGQTLFVTQSLDGSENQTGLGDQTIQIDGQHLLLTDATALEDGIEVPGQEILVQSLDREVFQDGQLIGNVLQIETSEGIKLVEHPIEYQLINNAKTAATNETNAIMPPIMSALEIPSSKSELVINSKSNETGLIGQNLDDSLAVIGVTQSSAVRSSLELPITITNPAIAPKTSNPINIGNLYGSGLSQQSQISPTLSSQDPNQLTYELFTSSNVISVSQHNQHQQNIFSDVSGNFKNNECRTTQISAALENQCLNEIILQSGAGTSNRGGGIIQQGNEFILGGEQVCDQFAVVESQGASDSNSAYSNPTR